MIGISMGDANGVGPEILLRTYLQGKLPQEFLVIGDLSVLKFCAEHLNLKMRFHQMSSADDYRTGVLNVLDAAELNVNDITIGKLSIKTGYASLKYVETGTKLALKKKISALVTLPINKEAIRATVKDFSGHTGYIAGLCQTTDYTMMLVSEKLIVTHVSTHVSLREAIERVQKDRILKVIRMTDAAIKKMKKASRIAVAGLNPHAGENNSFGKEDSMEIAPAVQQAMDEGINVTGPLAADTVFYLAKKGQFDAVVCMYHDQGHIPIKLLDFESAVNVTLGLPIIRTSVDHGTAFDIAYKGLASTDSFVNAFNLAQALV